MADLQSLIGRNALAEEPRHEGFANTAAEARDIDRQIRLERMAQSLPLSPEDVKARNAYYQGNPPTPPSESIARSVDSYIPSLYAFPSGVMDFFTVGNTHHLVRALRPLLGDNGIDVAPETEGQMAHMRQRYPLSYYAGRYGPPVQAALTRALLPPTGVLTALSIATDPNLKRIYGDRKNALSGD